MSESKELKTLTVNGEDINYIEYTADKGYTYFNTTFIKISIPENYEEAFKAVGGYSREMLYTKMLECDKDVDTLVIMSTVTEQESVLIRFIFEKDGIEVGRIASVEGSFLQYTINFFHENESILGKFDIENSLHYKDHPKYGVYTEDYVQPKDVNQSGLEYNDEPILYGETFEISGLTKVEGMFSGELQRMVTVEGIDTMRVEVKDYEGLYGILSNNYMVKADGTLYTDLENYKNCGDFEEGQSEESIKDELMESDVRYLNRRVDKYKEKLVRDDKSVEEIEKGLTEYKEQMRYDEKLAEMRAKLEEELNEPYLMLITKNGLNRLLKNPNITVTFK